MDSIYALSSGSVPSGVAVIRLSGPLAGAALQALAGTPPPPRQAALRRIRRADGNTIDRGLVLWFPSPSSETGEDMAELQLHGSRAVVRAVFDVLGGLGLRLAEPGEFIRRAFRSGKLDLTEVEGLADLIAADTEVQLCQAARLSQGGLAQQAEAWRESLLGLRAEVEARLDFSDEGDVAEALPADFEARVGALRSGMTAAISDATLGERVREGFRVAILGLPNAGKSSLLNALARRDVAIVTPEPGTTRDVLEVPLDLHGYPVLLFDTAGIRDAASKAEQEGVRRARLTAETADLVLWLEDGTLPADSPAPLLDRPVWRVRTKLDLLEQAQPQPDDLGISVVSGAGIADLIAKLTEAAERSLGRGRALVTRQRQRDAISDAAKSLQGIEAGRAEEVIADLLRQASEAIGRLTGRVGVEDMLDRLFREFCIGK